MANRSWSSGIRLLRWPCSERPRIFTASDGFSKIRQGRDPRPIAWTAVRTATSLTTSELLRSQMVQLIREITETRGEVRIGELGAIINERDPIFSPRSDKRRAGAG